MTISSQYVNKILFSPVQVHVWRNENARQSIMRQHFNSCPPAPMDSTDNVLESHTKAYKHYVKTQKALSGNGKDKNIMARAFRQFPSLKVLEVSTWSPHIGAAEVYREFGVLSGHELDMEGSHSLFVLIGALTESGTTLDHFRIGSLGESKMPVPGGLKMVAAERPLQLELSDHSVYLQSKTMRRVFTDMGQRKLEPLFSKLQTLEIFPLEQPFRDFEWQDEKAQALSKIMLCASSVETLVIRNISETNPPASCHLSFTYLLSKVSMPKLRILNLQGLDAKYREVETFFVRHASTLVNVEMHEVKMLKNRKWIEMLILLQSLPFKKLKRFTLSRCFHREVSLDITDYILHRTDVHAVHDHMNRQFNSR